MGWMEREWILVCKAETLYRVSLLLEIENNSIGRRSHLRSENNALNGNEHSEMLVQLVQSDNKIRKVVILMKSLFRVMPMIGFLEAVWYSSGISTQELIRLPYANYLDKHFLLMKKKSI
jgi:hypothetical protein